MAKAHSRESIAIDFSSLLFLFFNHCACEVELFVCDLSLTVICLGLLWFLRLDCAVEAQARGICLAFVVACDFGELHSAGTGGV